MKSFTDQDYAKQAAGARAAAELCQDGMRLGLGSGTTSHFFVRALALRVADGLQVVGVPTSASTRDLASDLGIPLASLRTACSSAPRTRSWSGTRTALRRSVPCPAIPLVNRRGWRAGPRRDSGYRAGLVQPGN